MSHVWERDGVVVSTDAERVDVAFVHRWLSEESYWARGRSREVMERAIRNSIVFGAYDGDRQVGFARVISDGATFAWLADVFVDPSARGRGIGEFLLTCALAHPDLQGLRRWVLATRDAHGLYARHGFTPLGSPERWMERSTPTPPDPSRATPGVSGA